jgi:hypothetical protein
LREQEQALAGQLADPAESFDPQALATVADRLRDTLAAGEPEQTKALLRLLIKELRVNGRSEILPTYRVVTPEVCATPSSVERTGIEPVTSGLQTQIRQRQRVALLGRAPGDVYEGGRLRGNLGGRPR